MPPVTAMLLPGSDLVTGSVCRLPEPVAQIALLNPTIAQKSAGFASAYRFHAGTFQFVKRNFNKPSLSDQSGASL
jgi:hypothetical protein